MTVLTRRSVATSIRLIAMSVGLGWLGLAWLGLTACSDKEDQPLSQAAMHKTSLPPYPAWSERMIGQSLSHFVTGQGTCVGVFDVISDRYTGPRSGMIGAGWGWDVAAKRPVQHIIFVNANDIVVGAAEGGVPRPDVPQARQDVTSPNVGWRGVIGITGGKVLAVGVTARNAACNVGSFDLSSVAS